MSQGAPGLPHASRPDGWREAIEDTTRAGSFSPSIGKRVALFLVPALVWLPFALVEYTLNAHVPPSVIWWARGFETVVSLLFGLVLFYNLASWNPLMRRDSFPAHFMRTIVLYALLGAFACIVFMQGGERGGEPVIARYPIWSVMAFCIGGIAGDWLKSIRSRGAGHT